MVVMIGGAGDFRSLGIGKLGSGVIEVVRALRPYSGSSSTEVPSAHVGSIFWRTL